MNKYSSVMIWSCSGLKRCEKRINKALYGAERGNIPSKYKYIFKDLGGGVRAFFDPVVVGTPYFIGSL